MNDVLPVALQCGISKKEFMHMTLTDVYMVIEADQKNKEDSVKMQEFYAWQQGRYFMEAVSATVINCLAQPKEPYEYPHNPLISDEEYEKMVEEHELKKMIAAEEAYIALHKSHGLKVPD